MEWSWGWVCWFRASLSHSKNTAGQLRGHEGWSKRGEDGNGRDVCGTLVEYTPSWTIKREPALQSQRGYTA